MKLFLLPVFLISFNSFPQEDSLSEYTQPDFHSPQNIKKFGDYLFCEKDYLRSVDEYKKYIEFFPDDTVRFKIGLALSGMKKYNEAAEYLSKTDKSSAFYVQSRNEYCKSLFKSEKFDLLRENFNENSKSIELIRLNYLSYLYSPEIPVPEYKFLNSFPDYSREKIKGFYTWKNDPPLKSELTAVVLSTILPGAGKFYIKKYGDGIAAFAATILFGYLSYDNFKADHKFRGWLFGGISAFFYAGNIYGSAAGVQIYNAKLYLDFYNDLNLYLEQQNYFFNQYDFCR